MNDKELYKILNSIDIEEKDFEYAEVNELEKMQYKKNFKKAIKKKEYKKYIGVAAIIGIVLGGLFIAEPAIAYEIPLIGDFLLEKKIENKEYEKYVETIGTTKEIAGRKLTLVAAVMDNNKLEVSYKLTDSKGRLNPKNNLLSEGEVGLQEQMTGEVFIDGKKVSNSGSGDWEIVDDKKMLIYKNYNLEDEKLGEKVNVEIRIKELFDKKGDFGFKFTLDNKEINKNSVSLEGVKTTNKNIEIKKINVTPLSLKITAKINGFNDMIVVDDKGNILEGGWAGSKGSGENCERYFEYIPKGEIKWIECIPVISETEKIKEGKGALFTKEKVFNESLKGEKILINEYRGLEIKEIIKDGEYLVIKNNPWVKDDFYSFPHSQFYIKDGEERIEPHFEGEYLKILEKYDEEGVNIDVFKVSNFENLEIGIKYYDVVKFLPKESFKIDVGK